MKERKIGLFECEVCQLEFYVGNRSSEYCDNLFCPTCGNNQVTEIGIREISEIVLDMIKDSGNQKYYCQACHRQYITNSKNRSECDQQEEPSYCPYCRNQKIMEFGQDIVISIPNSIRRGRIKILKTKTIKIKKIV